ncbi:MAG: branched-chain amino acid ABC transporter permease [Chloroflexota bacterium]|nr:branched-chain amino acid ABC transporter permease [Chloroflexota bacterium]
MGCVYALIAVGLTLIFGLMEIVNFAHGEFLMLAMFTAFWLWALFGLDPLLSLPACAALLFALGVLTYKGIISRVLAAPMLAQIIATFGLGVFLRSAAQFLWSPDYRVISNPILAGRVNLPGDLFIGRAQLVASLVALVAFASLWWLVNRTELGLALRATAEDRDAAALMGISAERVFALGWGIGALCVGVAGALLANFFYIFPDVGFLFGLIAYVAVALGGFGSIAGALAAGIVIGLVETLSGLLVAPALKYVAVFSLYLLVVLARPQGLLGRY